MPNSALPTPARERRSDTRERLEQEILEAAKRLFSVRGYTGVSLDHIAKEVGTAKQNLLYYFASKEALTGVEETRELDQRRNARAFGGDEGAVDRRSEAQGSLPDAIRDAEQEIDLAERARRPPFISRAQPLITSE